MQKSNSLISKMITFVLGISLSLSFVLGTVFFGPISVIAAEGDDVSIMTTGMDSDEPVSNDNKAYEIYPKPHIYTQQEGSFYLTGLKLYLPDNLSEYSRLRLQEIIDLKKLSVENAEYSSFNAEHHPNTTLGEAGNLYIKILSDEEIRRAKESSADSWQAKTDAYSLSVDNGNIKIEAISDDAAFYALTSLYQVLQQVSSLSLNNFSVTDWADVSTRGFIEGYYGNPWSVEDRKRLMTWGGYYKLNAYIYAPKDDPKHNRNWRGLYTEEELERTIKPLAEAGNKSKVKYVFALHPFMYSPFNFKNNYEHDLNVLKAKFLQVIKVGVRQIAILADDARDFGIDNYARLLKDMEAWLIEQKKTYSDLNTTILFCTQDYMSGGNGGYKKFPASVQVMVTGGKVWGEVSNNFGKNFTNRSGRAPLYWINWPCSDNSKRHLIMGGYSDFLHPNVETRYVEGIVLNPMQQSEPSKVAIFGNACYSWNIWKSRTEAEELWDKSFSFVDHNSVIPTEASQGLKELSRHMINQAMDGRVVALQESLNIKDKLRNLRSKLDNQTYGREEIQDLKNEFLKLDEALTNYQTYAGNTYTKNQIEYWLNSWRDTIDAFLNFMKMLEAKLDNNQDELISAYSLANQQFEKSKSYKFWYMDHYERAEVGVQHIVPTLVKLNSYGRSLVQSILDPHSIRRRFITSRTDNYEGAVESVFDNNENSGIIFKQDVWIKANQYFGVAYDKLVDLHNLKIVTGAGKNHYDRAKIQYTADLNLAPDSWKDLSLTINNDFVTAEGTQGRIVLKNSQINNSESLQVAGLRLLATENNKKDAWLEIKEIGVNLPELDDVNPARPEAKLIAGQYSSNRDKMNGSAFDVLKDGKDSSEVWLSNKSGKYKDALQEGSVLTYTFDQGSAPSNLYDVGEVYIAQGASNRNDIVNNAVLEYQDAADTWHELKTITGGTNLHFDFSDLGIKAKALRIRVTKYKQIWWRVGEFTAKTAVGNTSKKPIVYHTIKTDAWTIYQGNDGLLRDGNDGTFIWFNPSPNNNNGRKKDHVMVGDFLGYDLGKLATLASIHLAVGSSDNSGDKIEEYAVEYSADNVQWHPVSEQYAHYHGKTKGQDLLNIVLNNLKARYVRVRNLKEKYSWCKFAEFTVVESRQEGSTDNAYNNLANPADLKVIDENSSLRFDKANITLNTDKYIGFKFDKVRRIEAIKGLEELKRSLAPGVKLIVETAVHPKLWYVYNGEAADATAKTTDAKYIRFRFTTDDSLVKEQALDLSHVVLEYYQVHDKKVSSDFANNSQERDVRTKGNLKAVFDNNLSSYVEFTGPQIKNKKIIFDLGRSINFDNFRYYIRENSKDYPRSLSFALASNPSGPWEEFMQIGPTAGESVDNVSNESTAKSYDTYLHHDSDNPGYMYKEASSIAKTGRYLKLEVTNTYSHRWLEIGELKINGGAYLSPESYFNIETTMIEKPGHQPSMAYDNNYNSTYVSAETGGSFTYKVDKENQHSIKVTSLKIADNVKLTATVLDKNTPVNVNESFKGRTEEIVLGNLYSMISEFSLPEDKELIAVRFDLADDIPEILEITTSAKVLVSADKEELRTLLAKKPDSTNWLNKDKEQLASAAAEAQKVLDNPYATKEMVDAAVSALKKAMNVNSVKGDTAELQQIKNSVFVNSYLSNVSSENVNVYENGVFSKIQSLQRKIVNILNSKIDDLSENDISVLLNQWNEELNSLKYSPNEKIMAEILLNQEDSRHNDLRTKISDYTETSYNSYMQAYQTLQEIYNEAELKMEQKAELTTDLSTSLPVKLNEARFLLKAAASSLVNISGLNQWLQTHTISTEDEKLYTSESMQAYKAVLAEAVAFRNNGQLQDLSTLMSKLENAFNSLQTVNNDELSDLYQRLKALSPNNYTRLSYNKLQEALVLYDSEMSKSKADRMSDSDLLQKLKDAQGKLVSVIALQSALQNLPVSYDQVEVKNKYTKSEVQALDQILIQVAEAKESGSKEQIEALVTALNDAVAKLSLNALNIENVEKKRADILNNIISDSELTRYTEATAEAYKEAIANLQAINDLQSVSMDRYDNLLNKVTEAIKALTLKSTDEKDLILQSDTSTSDPKSLTVKLKVSSVLPDDSYKLQLKEVLHSDQVADKIKEKSELQDKDFELVDIVLLKKNDSGAYQETHEIVNAKVTLNTDKAENTKVKIYLARDEQLQYIGETVVKDAMISFIAPHFSEYFLVYEKNSAKDLKVDIDKFKPLNFDKNTGTDIQDLLLRLDHNSYKTLLAPENSKDGNTAVKDKQPATDSSSDTPIAALIISSLAILFIFSILHKKSKLR